MRSGILLICFALAGLQAYGSDWSDTSIGFRQGSAYREPYNKEKINKHIVSLTHASGYAYGSNFFTVDMLTSDSKDPASGGDEGAQEVFALYRTTVNLKPFGVEPGKGVIRDLGMTAGFDFGAKDDQFSSRTRRYVLGPKVSFDVPGFLAIAVVMRTEKNHNWYATGSGFGKAGCVGTCNPDIVLKNTYSVEAAWSFPFNLGLPLQFNGFLTYVGAKGKDATGNDTKPELLTEPALMVDISSFWGRKGAVLAGFSYQYWDNKFGNNASSDSSGGSKASAPQINAEVHF